MSDTFDPTAPEGDIRGGSQYLSKRDIKAIAIVLLLLSPLLWFAYKLLEKNGQKAVCSTNMQAIAGALNQYAESFDTHFPPVYEGYEYGFPILDKGRARSWATTISGYMKTRASFNCPTASDDESIVMPTSRPIDQNNLTDRNRRAGEERLSYGFYAPYSAYAVADVPNPNTTVIVAETSNMGFNGSFDPLPFKDPDGKVTAFDCFLIGFDNSNSLPSSATKSVTRLAFYNSKNGIFDKDTQGRHGEFIHGLTAGGSLINLDPLGANLTKSSGGSLGGAWSVPATIGQ